MCGNTAPRNKGSLESCDIPCEGDPKFACGGNEGGLYLSVMRLVDTPEGLNARSHDHTLVEDGKTVNTPLAQTREDETAEGKAVIDANPGKTEVIVAEPKSTYMGCFAVKGNPGVLATHVNCNLEMSNKVRKSTMSTPSILVRESYVVTAAWNI